jgi:hypothetical protein
MLVRGTFERYDVASRCGAQCGAQCDVAMWSTMRRRDGQFLYRLSADIADVANAADIAHFTDVGEKNGKKTYSLYYLFTHVGKYAIVRDRIVCELVIAIEYLLSLPRTLV